MGIKRFILPILLCLLFAYIWMFGKPLILVPTIEPVWGTKPVLGYFTLTSSLAEPLQQGVGLSQEQFQKVQKITRREVRQLRILEQESRVIIDDSTLSLEEKQLKIREMGYNQRVNGILFVSEEKLRKSLGDKTYMRMVKWINQRWPVERYLHGKPASNKQRTYRIFATRYDSNGVYTVALPDRCVKFANAGSHFCDDYGYVAGGDYSIYLSYEKGVGVSVGESGPWNIDDTFWATLNDPTPRRMFADLALGMPEAQAAYYNGYNGGADQFGRKVTGPYGIDLARDVSIDIGLLPGNNDWVNVSFLWTDSWGGGGSQAPAAPTRSDPSLTRKVSTLAATKNLISPVVTATPNPDGSVVHEVQPGQALWSIAIAYNTKIKDIQELNKLTGTVIFSGMKLVIVPGGQTITPEAGEMVTGTLSVESPTVAPSPTSTSTRSVVTRVITTTVGGIAQLTPTSDIPPEEGRFDPMLILISGIALVGALLILLGTIFVRK